jgi:hypothetical protein
MLIPGENPSYTPQSFLSHNVTQASCVKPTLDKRPNAKRGMSISFIFSTELRRRRGKPFARHLRNKISHA